MRTLLEKLAAWYLNGKAINFVTDGQGGWIAGEKWHVSLLAPLVTEHRLSNPVSDYPYPFNTGYHFEKEYQRWREDYQRANGYMGWPFLTLRRWALELYEKLVKI